ncbi:MAG: GlsB/YeaQ/YmgE family stress response membrane protein [Chloroflexota bacterium]
MTLLGLLILLLIAAVAGALGQMIAGYSIGGCFASIVVGFVGALIGMWLAQQFGLPEPLPINVQGQTFPLLWSVVGSAVLSLLLGLLTRRRI